MDRQINKLTNHVEKGTQDRVTQIWRVFLKLKEPG